MWRRTKVAAGSSVCLSGAFIGVLMLVSRERIGEERPGYWSPCGMT